MYALQLATTANMAEILAVVLRTIGPEPAAAGLSFPSQQSHGEPTLSVLLTRK